MALFEGCSRVLKGILVNVLYLGDSSNLLAPSTCTLPSLKVISSFPSWEQDIKTPPKRALSQGTNLLHWVSSKLREFANSQRE